MSNYGWESGTIKLPSAEFSRLRKAVEAADRKAKEQVFDRTQTFWKGLTRKQQTDPKAYAAAVAAYSQAGYADLSVRKNRLGWGAPDAARDRIDADTALLRDTVDKLTEVADFRYDPQTRARVPGKVRRVQVADMSYPTNRTTTWPVAHEGSITFDRESSSIRWATGDNNHQVEHAHDDPLAKALFAELDKVRWTRGTGGTFIGNNEHNEDAGRYEAGAGATYVAAGFGPVGAADPDAYHLTKDYRDSTGKLVRQADFPGRKAWERQFARATRGSRTSTRTTGGGPSRVPAGVRTGGQFSTRGRGESTVRL